MSTNIKKKVYVDNIFKEKRQKMIGKNYKEVYLNSNEIYEMNDLR